LISSAHASSAFFFQYVLFGLAFCRASLLGFFFFFFAILGPFCCPNNVSLSKVEPGGVYPDFLAPAAISGIPNLGHRTGASAARLVKQLRGFDSFVCCLENIWLAGVELTSNAFDDKIPNISFMIAFESGNLDTISLPNRIELDCPATPFCCNLKLLDFCFHGLYNNGLFPVTSYVHNYLLNKCLHYTHAARPLAACANSDNPTPFKFFLIPFIRLPSVPVLV